MAHTDSTTSTAKSRCASAAGSFARLPQLAAAGIHPVLAVDARCAVERLHADAEKAAGSAGNGKQLNMPEQNENQHDDEDQSNAATGCVAPLTAMRPSGDGPEQQQD